MKIGLVSPYDFSFSGGVNNHISHLAKYFVQWGHEVKILAPCSRKVGGNHPCEIIAIGRPFPFSAIGTVARIPVSPWLPFQVALTLQREKFDILHIHEPLIPLLPLSVLLTSNTVNIGTFHAFHDTPRFYRFARHYLKKCLPRLHGKIAVSETARSFIAHHLPAQYDIIPNGIDIERFSRGTKRPEFNDGKLNILFVGRPEKRKGLDYLLRAYAKVKAEIPESRLIVVGAGVRGRNKYEKISAELNINDIIYTGFVPDAELSSYYQSADIFCAPAINGESFGIILLEAMACGIPVIASNVPGYAGVISHEEDGLLVEPGNEDLLAQAIQLLSQDNLLRKKMSDKGQAKAEHYRWEYIAGQVMEYYYKCLLGKNNIR
jgi:phosphatidylinositol alpha-mannosyltransferase